MKKIIWPICLGLILLTGCQSNGVKEAPKKKAACTVKQKEPSQRTAQNTTFSYPQLLPAKSGHYSLLTVGTLDEKSPIEKDKNITKKVHEILSLPLEQAQKIYPKLQIKNDPTFILFDQNGIAHQATNLNDLKQFLEKNQAN
jgi:PBP1b-binding outer membrane lipoprotein LpoB